MATTWVNENRNGRVTSEMELDDQEDVSRLMSIGDDWQELFLVVRLSINGPASNLAYPTMGFIGLCASAAKSFATAGSHAIGFRFDVGWTYNASGWYTVAGWPTLCLNGVISNLNSGFQTYYQRTAQWSHDSHFFLRIAKGNPNWAMQVGYVDNPSQWSSPVPIELLRDVAEVGLITSTRNLLNVPAAGTYAVQNVQSFTPPDEANDGAFTDVNYFWMTPGAAKMRVADLQVARVV